MPGSTGTQVMPEDADSIKQTDQSERPNLRVLYTMKNRLVLSFLSFYVHTTALSK